MIKHWAVQKSGHRDTPMQEVVVMVAAMAVKMLMTMPMIVFHNFAFMMFKLFLMLIILDSLTFLFNHELLE